MMYRVILAYKACIHFRPNIKNDMFHYFRSWFIQWETFRLAKGTSLAISEKRITSLVIQLLFQTRISTSSLIIHPLHARKLSLCSNVDWKKLHRGKYLALQNLAISQHEFVIILQHCLLNIVFVHRQLVTRKPINSSILSFWMSPSKGIHHPFNLFTKRYKQSE